jgi:hypothetical protein
MILIRSPELCLVIRATDISRTHYWKVPRTTPRVLPISENHAAASDWIPLKTLAVQYSLTKVTHTWPWFAGPITACSAGWRSYAGRLISFHAPASSLAPETASRRLLGWIQISSRWGVPVQRPGRADAAECKHDHSTEHAEMRTVVLPVLRDRATAMASLHRGDRQPTPVPGMARRRGPVVATWW